MATIGELTSTTTHEFNNLLMTILNYAKMGLRHKDEASRDKARELHRNAIEALSVFDQEADILRRISAWFVERQN